MSESMHDDFEQEDGEVGYCKPPKRRQFKKGVSGNPSGRPKKAPDFDSLLLRELCSKLIITEAGKRKKVTKSEVIAKQIVNKASSGHLPTLRLILPHYLKALERLAEEQKPAEVSLRELTHQQLLYIATNGGKDVPPLDWRYKCPNCSK